jgi:hypothetical protein
MRYDDSGPAFPAPDLGEQDFGQRGAYPGMTLRDYFAAKAMPGLLALCQHDSHEGKSYIEYVAGLSYGMADAMMKARILVGEGEKP